MLTVLGDPDRLDVKKVGEAATSAFNRGRVGGIDMFRRTAHPSAGEVGPNVRTALADLVVPSLAVATVAVPEPGPVALRAGRLCIGGRHAAEAGRIVRNYIRFLNVMASGSFGRSMPQLLLRRLIPEFVRD